MKKRVLVAVIIVAATAAAAYTLHMLDMMVYDTFRSYGLQFNYEWANPYWNLLRIIWVLLYIIAAATIVSTILSIRPLLRHASESARAAAVLRPKLRFSLKETVTTLMLASGSISLIASLFYSSNMLAFVGLGLVFWGILVPYVTSAKYVKLELLDAALGPSFVNTERLLEEFELDAKGIYLPPKYFRHHGSSMVFIPSDVDQVPELEEIAEEESRLKSLHGILLMPPGAGLADQLEKESGSDFLGADLPRICEILPIVFVEMQTAKHMEVRVEKNTVVVEITDHIFNTICQETKKLPRTHELIGCVLASAIACIVAKVTGKPVTIEDDTTEQGKRTTIRLNVLNGQHRDS